MPWSQSPVSGKVLFTESGVTWNRFFAVALDREDDAVLEENAELISESLMQMEKLMASDCC